MMKDFYSPFHKLISDADENTEKKTNIRTVGVDPKSGNNVYVRIGKYGAMAQIGETESEEKPKFASLLNTQSIETITLEEVLDLFSFPKTLGEFNDENVIISNGRFGPYIRMGSTFVSIKQDEMSTIDLEDAIKRIEEKQELDRKKYIHIFADHKPEVKVMNGRYGPYISYGKRNVKIPKDQDPNTLTLEQCLDIISNAKPYSRKREKVTIQFFF